MRLFIAEKPDLAKAICTGLGGGFIRKDGYWQHPIKNDVVTYCFGHMLALKDPEDIDSKYQYWNMEQLPIPPFLPAKRKIPKDKKEQVTIIGELIKKADIIINAGDPDEEGQLLVDELLRYFNNKKPVFRVLINDNTEAVVKKALDNLKPNSDFEHLGYKAESRTIADQLFGYNITRAYSLSQQAKTGQRQTMHIGRVQTPILGLVVRKDRANAGHKKSFYYVITGDFMVNGLQFTAKYHPKDTDPTDNKGRLVNKNFAQNLSALLSNKPAKITLGQTTAKSEPAPLLYNLLKLQQDASRMFGLKPDDVMKITQSLREKHKLITYNRSDCQYLSDEQFADVADVICAINHTLPKSDGVCTKANPNIKGRAFNSAKVSAHHAIIPTTQQANWANLSQDEQNIYRIIARAYLAQFYPPYEYDETKLIIDVIDDSQSYQFHTTARVDTASGWKFLYSKDTNTLETQVDEEIKSHDLRSVSSGDDGICQKTISSEQETKPQPLYTITSLLGDLTQVAKYVKDPNLAKILKDKDKDKQGEHGGIGTPATRSAIINNLFERGYLTEKGKSIVSTPKAQALYDLLDDKIRYPDMTAIWEEQQRQIKNENDVQAFINQMQSDIITPIITQLQENYTPSKHNDLSNNPPCPKCARPLRRFESKYKKGEFYWRCTGWNTIGNPCNHLMDDKDGTPVEKQPKPPKHLTEFTCKQCGSKLRRYDGTSKKTGKPYTIFNCSNFPKCTQSYWEKDGKPDYG